MPDRETLIELIRNERRFIEELLVIEDKQRQRVPFLLNPIQSDAIETATGRDIHVKPAQVGFSSLKLAQRLINTLTVPGTNTVLIAYEDFITERLLSKTEFFYNYLSSLGIPNFPAIHHDCLPYHTKVQLEDGSFRSIGQIVNKQENVNVLTCNLESGDVEPKPITRWFKYPSNHLWIVLGSGYKFSHMMTPNHHILVGDKWIMAGDVEIGDTTYHNGFIPNDDQKQLIVGSLLGDASFSGVHGVKFAQANYGYAKFKHDILVGESSELKTEINHGYSSNPIYTFGLHACPYFESYGVGDLDPKGLAVWYCDDGNYNPSNGSVCFHTECFDYQTQLYMKSILRQKFGVISEVRPREGYFYLVVPNPKGSNNHDKFFSLIAPYVPECMDYKLPSEFRRSKYQWDTRFEFGLIPYKVNVKDVALTSDRIYNYEYSLEVADNHNFFTSVGLCKNSTYEKTFRFYLNGKVASKSSIYIASARSYVAGRAETIHHLLCDEFAFWAPGAMERIFSPALDRVPPDGTVDVFSTPNGEDNDFCEMYRLAKEGKSIFTAHFYPWFMHPEYTIPFGDPRIVHIPETDCAKFDLSQDEEQLVANYGVTLGQIRWRRWKIKEKESLRRTGETRMLFAQEFPENDVSCFLATGDMYYDSVVVDEKARDCYPAPIHRNGLNVWFEPEEGKHYIVAIDPGQAKVTQTAITVLMPPQDGCDRWKYCARDAGLYTSDPTAAKAVEASIYYNNAMVTWEANSHGVALSSQGSPLRGRRNIYYRRDIVSGRQSSEPGWLTTSKNKDYMFASLHRELPSMEVHDIEFVTECRSIRQIGNKIMSVGADDIHDSVAIAIVCNNPTPIKRGLVGSTGWKW